MADEPAPVNLDTEHPPGGPGAAPLPPDPGAPQPPAQAGPSPPDPVAPPPPPPPSPSGGAALPSERPEIAVGAAFAGGFVLALILKRLAR